MMKNLHLSLVTQACQVCLFMIRAEWRLFAACLGEFRSSDETNTKAQLWNQKSDTFHKLCFVLQDSAIAARAIQTD